MGDPKFKLNPTLPPKEKSRRGDQQAARQSQPPPLANFGKKGKNLKMRKNHFLQNKETRQRFFITKSQATIVSLHIYWKLPEQGTNKLFSEELEHNCQCFQMESVKVSAHLNGWPPFVNGSEGNTRRELSRFRNWRHRPPPFSLCARLIMEGASLAGISLIMRSTICRYTIRQSFELKAEV